MPKTSLTIEIKEYLDERFDHVLDKIKGVDEKVTKLNGSVNSTIIRVDKNANRLVEVETFIKTHTVFREQLANVTDQCEKIKGEQKKIFLALIIGSFLWIKESRDFIVHTVLGMIGGL